VFHLFDYKLNAHIENVTAIAKGMPTAAVANTMYSKLLPGVLDMLGESGSSNSDQLKMAIAVHQAMPTQISYDAIAATLLTMLARRVESDEMTSVRRSQRLRRLRLVIRALAVGLGSDFDGSSLMRSFLSLDVSGQSWSPDDEEDKARLMFQCVTMHASVLAGTSTGGLNSYSRQPSGDRWSPSTENNVRKALLSARKSLLSWCCVDYAPMCSDKVLKRGMDTESDGASSAGVGAPDFRSALGPSRGEEKISSSFNIMRCLLFLEDADSSLMKEFVVPDGPSADEEAEFAEELSRIRICCELGAGVDDEMLWIVIRASASSKGVLPAHVAITLLENLFERCAHDHAGLLSVNDPTILWELYGLVEYSPSERRYLSDDSQNGDQDNENGKNEDELPR